MPMLFVSLSILSNPIQSNPIQSNHQTNTSYWLSAKYIKRSHSHSPRSVIDQGSPVSGPRAAYARTRRTLSRGLGAC